MVGGLEAKARPYQREDAHRALDTLQTRRAVLLGHEPGLGKTLITLIIAASLSARRILIDHAPPFARLVLWKKRSSIGSRGAGRERLVVIRPGLKMDD